MSKVLRIGLALFVSLSAAGALFGGGFLAGHLTAAGPLSWQNLFTPGQAASAQAGTPPDLKSTFSPFWEAWDIVHKEYVDQPVDDTKLMQGAISGMLDALGDQHTGYMSPAEYKVVLSSQQGELEGIGASVEPGGDYVRIASTIAGSPAERAGLQAGDAIVTINGQDMKGVDYYTVITLVRGPAGSTVHLGIQRQEATDLLQIDIVRAKINVPSVDSKMLDSRVAYVHVYDFGDKTTDELRAALRNLLAQQPVGLVLDLRGNPGGYLNTAIEVASQFIGDGVVMRERFGNGQEQTYEAQSGGLATTIPLVVLIDKGSASASEIVAGAIQDRGRGTLVGETSFGKGSVQNWHALTGDNGAVRVTIARWLTPNGRSIHGQGITPDVAVEFTEQAHAAGRDPQLDKAVEILLAQ